VEEIVGKDRQCNMKIITPASTTTTTASSSTSSFSSSCKSIWNKVQRRLVFCSSSHRLDSDYSPTTIEIPSRKHSKSCYVNDRRNSSHYTPAAIVRQSTLNAVNSTITKKEEEEDEYENAGDFPSNLSSLNFSTCKYTVHKSTTTPAAMMQDSIAMRGKRRRRSIHNWWWKKLKTKGAADDEDDKEEEEEVEDIGFFTIRRNHDPVPAAAAVVVAAGNRRSSSTLAKTPSLCFSPTVKTSHCFMRKQYQRSATITKTRRQWSLLSEKFTRHDEEDEESRHENNAGRKDMPYPFNSMDDEEDDDTNDHSSSHSCCSTSKNDCSDRRCNCRTISNTSNDDEEEEEEEEEEDDEYTLLMSSHDDDVDGYSSLTAALAYSKSWSSSTTKTSSSLSLPTTTTTATIPSVLLQRPYCLQRQHQKLPPPLFELV
jgi:hypothetical protein